MAKPKIKHTITKKEWDKKHKDFKLMGKDGIPYIMAYDSKIGTHLVPVKIVKEEMDESVGAELDLIKQSSKDVKDFIKKVFRDSDFRAMKNDKDFVKYLKSMYEGIESVNEAKEPEVITTLRKIVKNKQNDLIKDTKSGKKVRVDMNSANLMVQVYDALKQSNKDKFVKSGIVAMGHMAYKLMRNESVNESTRQNLGMNSSVSKRRAGAELKQKLKGKRSDGMGKYTATIYGLNSNGKRVELKSLNDLNKYSKFEIDESVNEAKVNYNFSEDELKRVLKLLGRNASTEIKMIKAFEKAFGRKLTRDELFESVNEGKKRFKRQDGIGKAKYTISFHDGKKKHKDGSDFFDIKIFKNKKDLSDFVGTLTKQGYKLTRESVNEGKFDGIGDLVKSLHFEINPKTAEEKKIELGKRQGEVSKRKQKESGEYSLRLFRKKIKYGNGKDVGVFLPGSYDAVTSKLGDGPHKKAVKKVRWTQKKYDQWLEDMASNGGARNAFDMAQNAKNEPGLIDWVKKNFRGDKPLQRIQWDIEGFNESVNEAKDVEVYHKSYTHAIEAAQNYAGKKGYEIEDDEMFTKVGMNSKRPSVGKTTKVSLELLKNGKPQRKMLHIQVYGMKNGYELNVYIN